MIVAKIKEHYSKKKERKKGFSYEHGSQVVILWCWIKVLHKPYLLGLLWWLGENYVVVVQYCHGWILKNSVNECIKKRWLVKFLVFPLVFWKDVNCFLSYFTWKMWLQLSTFALSVIKHDNSGDAGDWSIYFLVCTYFMLNFHFLTPFVTKVIQLLMTITVSTVFYVKRINQFEPKLTLFSVVWWTKGSSNSWASIAGCVFRCRAS